VIIITSKFRYRARRIKKKGKEKFHFPIRLEKIIIKSEVTSLHSKVFAILQVTIHNFEYRLWKAHAEESKGDFGVSVNLAQLEESAGDLCWILKNKKEKHKGISHLNLDTLNPRK
jgi:hypothetical protein